MKIKYIVSNALGDTVEYSFRNPMKCRAAAINQLKLFRGEAKSYEGLKLSYSVCDIETIDLLTGRRQHSVEILEALDTEYEILANLDLPYSFPAAIAKTDLKQYTHLADDFVFLYYFTVE